MKYCYAVSTTVVDNKTILLFAPDTLGPCIGVNAETLEKEEIWKEPGGTMSMVQIPGLNGDFIAVQKFNPAFEAAKAKLVRVIRENNSWKVLPYFEMPYVHRIDIIQSNKEYYLICCTVCSSKKSVDDWSNPGSIYIAKIDPNHMENKPQFKVLKDGLTRNHGYWRNEEKGKITSYVSSDQGVFQITPPTSRNGQFTIKKVIDAQVSDVALCDIDGDGKLEIATIQPFHGTDFVVYHDSDNGYKEMYRYPTPMAFIHVAWAGELAGKTVFLGGCREKQKELFMLYWNGETIEKQIIEVGAGPSNVKKLILNGKEILAVANRETNEAAMFLIEKN